MQANAAAPGDGIGFLLDIFMSTATPKTSGALGSSSSGSSSSSISGHHNYSRGISTHGNTSIEPDHSHHTIGSRCYKVRAQLVQRVRYLTNHDLVADANDDVYMFWTKRVVAEEKVADILDLAATVDELQTTHVQWTLAVPHDAQGSLQSKGIQVQYDVSVDFFPLWHKSAGFSARGMLQSIIAKPGSHPVSCKLPLLIMPVPVSALLASPPVYAADRYIF
ncbi:hypothetical protein LPJ66_006839 [Kickxella alabastrina]|uniref:Uncharacterized protein n=1 Tax=Kickxella alabastrina TaxID=61397 RepID=A0ACC1IEW1_9FUNG|nr:hypothetical protein LPJ66_006839 [Kickxella alabastrina]